MATTSVDLKGKGSPYDQGFKGAAAIAGALVLVILVLILFTITKRAWPAFSLMGLDFFTTTRWAPPEEVFGAAAFIYGTILTSVIALILAVPVSLGIALFITQLAPTWMRKPVIYVMDLLAVVPSVVFGLWGILVFGPNVFSFYQRLNDIFGGVPVLGSIFGQPLSGRNFLTAGIILAVMITPIITSISREVIATTPQGEIEAAIGLGCTRWEVVKGSIMPHSQGGIVGAVMLGLGRAMGETIAVALVIGSSPQITANILAPGDSMAAVIANQWGEADGVYQSALLALAVTLFLLTVVVNVAATTVVQRSIRKSRGA